MIIPLGLGLRTPATHRQGKISIPRKQRQQTLGGACRPGPVGDGADEHKRIVISPLLPLPITTTTTTAAATIRERRHGGRIPSHGQLLPPVPAEGGADVQHFGGQGAVDAVPGDDADKDGGREQVQLVVQQGQALVRLAHQPGRGAVAVERVGGVDAALVVGAARRQHRRQHGAHGQRHVDGPVPEVGR